MSEAFVTLVGTHFRGSEAKRIVNDLTIGETAFELEREPENEYDANAIIVRCQGEHIGYVARGSNHDLAQLLDDGVEMAVKFIDLEGRKPVLQLTW